MNIFVLSLDPILAAEDLCDKHIVKMCLETAQLLSTAARMCGAETDDLYKSTHVNHPCSIWARSSRVNYRWLLLHGDAIGHEFARRYGKIHKSALVIQRARDFVELLPDTPMTDFAVAMPDQYKSSCPVESYRRYYAAEKKRIARWAHSFSPDWWPYQQIDVFSVNLMDTDYYEDKAALARWGNSLGGGWRKLDNYSKNPTQIVDFYRNAFCGIGITTIPRSTTLWRPTTYYKASKEHLSNRGISRYDGWEEEQRWQALAQEHYEEDPDYGFRCWNFSPE